MANCRAEAGKVQDEARKPFCTRMLKSAPTMRTHQKRSTNQPEEGPTDQI